MPYSPLRFSYVRVQSKLNVRYNIPNVLHSLCQKQYYEGSKRDRHHISNTDPDHTERMNLCLSKRLKKE